MTTKHTHTAKAKKPAFPVCPIFLLVQKFYLFVIDGEAFAIKNKEPKYIKQALHEDMVATEQIV